MFTDVLTRELTEWIGNASSYNRWQPKAGRRRSSARGSKTQL